MRISDWSSDVCSSDLKDSTCAWDGSAKRTSRLRYGVQAFGRHPHRHVAFARVDRHHQCDHASIDDPGDDGEDEQEAEKGWHGVKGPLENAAGRTAPTICGMRCRCASAAPAGCFGSPMT